jgi:hypothetical protein
MNALRHNEAQVVLITGSEAAATPAHAASSLPTTPASDARLARTGLSSADPHVLNNSTNFALNDLAQLTSTG